jgi:dsRNA-specific ribonuclease
MVTTVNNRSIETSAIGKTKKEAAQEAALRALTILATLDTKQTEE